MRINFSMFRDPDPYQSYFDAWQKARIGNELPHRRDIGLRDFAAHADNLIIIERRAPGFFGHRLVGSSVVERFGGVDPTTNVLEFHAPDVKDDVQSWMDCLLQTPCAGIAEFSTAYQDGTHRACQALILPIIGPDGAPMIFSLQHAFELIRISEPRDKPCVGLDYSVGHFIDIGWGLPEEMTSSHIAKPPPANLTHPLTTAL
ncbi:MAG: PAS domain-containing protein [Kordiimonadaceae bacterium]|nr:PAS domain-containing protein [Kordiimonadaceae bacterium]MBO6569460.1 PAS domain-containing protein [Kordiimonadaceae bacterium]MBO6964935.1 PAS domain-containing protein [Kordiimonadaceae bacterium]